MEICEEEGMHITERLDKETARDYALRILKDNIIRIELEPGSMISEKEIATELGLSRTPIREALIELSKSQIVEIFPQRGSMISLIDYDLVEEAYFARVVMEKAIVELACEKATDKDLLTLEENLMLQEFYLNNTDSFKLLELDNEFHMKLFQICNKKQCYEMVRSMSVHFDRVRSLSLRSSRYTGRVEEHRAIVSAIKERNPDLAKEIIQKHISSYVVDEKDICEKYPDYIKGYNKA